MTIKEDQGAGRAKLLNKSLLAGGLNQKGKTFTMKLKNWTGKKLFAGGVLVAVLAVAGATSSTHAAVNEPLKPADIVDTAVGAGQFKTLAAALEAAGLIDTLKGAGPFTVFAPTDEAFAKLPAGTVEFLLKPENKEKLKSILLYHVVSGNVPASKVVELNGRLVKTLQGSSIKVSTKHGVRVDNANVTKTDIEASNGVIHIIDTVLMPKM